MATTCDGALRPTAYVADSAANADPIHDAEYSYHKDGLVSGIDNNADAKFTQANDYDFAGRLKRNYVGTSGTSYPFRQTIGYDAFTNMTGRSTYVHFDEVAFTAGYTNNRKTSGGSTDSFDNAGNTTVSLGSDNTTYWYFDAAGRTARWEEQKAYGNSQMKGEETTFDGDGRPVKVDSLVNDKIGGTWTGWNAITTTTSTRQSQGKRSPTSPTTAPTWGCTSTWAERRSPIRSTATSSSRLPTPSRATSQNIDTNGEIFSNEDERTELAALDASLPTDNPTIMPPPDYGDGAYVGNPENGCTDEYDVPHAMFDRSNAASN